ncbi:MAG: hypothetical protein ACXW13_00045 [Burkholderiaceae bacterium]
MEQTNLVMLTKPDSNAVAAAIYLIAAAKQQHAAEYGEKGDSVAADALRRESGRLLDLARRFRCA